MNRNVLELPKVTSTTTCNSRTPKGLCGNGAGFKRVPKTKQGRCYLHHSTGRVPAINDETISRVSGELQPTISAHYQKVMNDPHLLSLDNEVGVLRTLLEKTLGSLPNDSTEWSMTEIHADKLKEIRLMADSIGKLFQKIMDVEERKKRVLSITDIMKIISQIGTILNSICKGCPKRVDLAKRIDEVKVLDAEYEEVS